MTQTPQIFPVILSGGVGSRLWPLSRQHYPKQMQPLASDKPMIVETALRVTGDSFAPPTIVCHQDHRFLTAVSLQDAGITPRALLLEPEGRNTLPAIAAAAFHIAKDNPDAVLAVLASDHRIEKPDTLKDSLLQLAKTAHEAQSLGTLGITPTHAETGYGYIKTGAPLSNESAICHVERFVEKPDESNAKAYIASGDYLWNAGIFVLPVRAFLDTIQSLRPDDYTALKTSVDGAVIDLDFTRLDGTSFADANNISIDHAIMENADNVITMPVDCGWNDLGSWKALWETTPHDANSNSLRGDVIVHDTQSSYIRAENGIMVAATGVKDTVIVATKDSVMVSTMDNCQNVKALVDALKEKGRSEYLTHDTVYQPWGHYRFVETGQDYQVKQISLNPGHGTSRRYHKHRSEHWIVTKGAATLTKGNETFTIDEGQSTFIPAGTPYRLSNNTSKPLALIEVQSGSIIDENDLIRLDEAL